MDFYHHLMQIQGFSMLLVLAFCVVLPVLSAIHCLFSTHSRRAKIIWCIALLLTLTFAAIAYMLVNAKRSHWLKWVVGLFIVLLLFNMAFPAGWHWYIVKDAKTQQAQAEQTLKVLNTSDLTEQQQQHVKSFTTVAMGIARSFSGSYTEAPPIAKRALLEAVTYLRMFNALTKDKAISSKDYDVLFPPHAWPTHENKHTDILSPLPIGR